MKTSHFVALFAFTSTGAFCQDLFNVNEHANLLRASAFTVRALGQNYREQNATRTLYALRAGYGITPRLSVLASGSLSNHHDKKLPPDLIGHTHVGSQTHYYTQPIRRGVKYPHLFNGFYLMARYMVIQDDIRGKPLKLGFYGEWSGVETAHDDAEPDLMNDTGGYGFGLVSTWKKNRFAAAFSSGVILPESYFEMQPDHSGGPDLPTTIEYGNALKYNLSFGYRLNNEKPGQSSRISWNAYLEFVGKKFEAANVVQNGVVITNKTVALREGYYVELHPGIQRLVGSMARLELSLALSMINSSYAHFTPVWTLAYQRYLSF